MITPIIPASMTGDQYVTHLASRYMNGEIEPQEVYTKLETFVRYKRRLEDTLETLQAQYDDLKELFPERVQELTINPALFYRYFPGYENYNR